MIRVARVRLPAVAARRLKSLIGRSERGRLTRDELAEYQALAQKVQATERRAGRSTGAEEMKRTTRLGRLLVVAGIAFWLGLPPSLVQAQPVKPGADFGIRGNGPVNGIIPPRVSILRLNVIKPDPALPGMPPGVFPRHRFGFEDAPREGTSVTLAIDEPQHLILSVEAKECKITTFRDDKNTDLALAKILPAGGERPFNPQPGPEECSF